ncbi:sulfatase-like hydrolase/transferase [Oscillospiraceae bacterium N12]|jgi:arylsulfatase A-like enzyme|uniref:Sulfatase-like hydrolase/transferase n=1 Tax=Jilunia laotingensis TaxID=2763675 RepID=A0A926F706_9BACT|nr:sulfatase-like hydrolase/transferase [Jilunia laotingensis]MBC8593019.1 sulfatase-like hydrolase/transferase [Jilunia laotingensis]
MNKSVLFLTACSGLAATMAVAQEKKPNIVIIYTDDMGIGDVSCYNSGWVMTPNIDRLAAKGLKFNHYYTSSPVSSPSRVGLTTGMFPTEWGINTFLHDRKGNAECEQSDYLDSSAPTIAKSLKAAGYATAHIGKWHMGGGRDVDDAPQIPKYGFDEYLSTYESPDPDKLITATNWIWSEKDSIKRWERTGYFVDKTLEYLGRHKGEPCFVNLWPDDMHTPWVPSADCYGKKKEWNGKENFMAVLEEYDRQIGRFMDGLERLGIADNTIVIFTSDNGAYPTFDQVRSNGHRGSKNSLYEGGVNMPFIIVWPDKIKAGEVDDETVINAVDIYPSLCAITGATQLKGFNYSGEDMSKALMGVKHQSRKKDMMWDFGRNRFFGHPAQPHQQSPHLALRRGDWKVLVNADGANLELFNIKEDPNETTNIANKYPEMAQEMSKKVINWYFTKRKLRQ